MNFFFFFYFLSYFKLLFSSYLLEVNSKLLWNSLNSIYFNSNTILFINTSLTSFWYDLNNNIKVNSYGYPNIPNIKLRYNESNDNIMSMICCMNNQFNNCKNIGIKNTFKVNENGFLSCFANDNLYTYGNNEGSIIAEINIQE